MKTVLWVIAGASVGVAAFLILNQPGPPYVGGDDDVEYAAGRTTFWGSKQRLFGAGSGFKGRLKEGLGRATGDADLAEEGVTDQVVGAVKDTAGQVAQAAGQTLHDLNR